jgi:hypothetical protein
MNDDEMRREVFLILANEPHIRLYPSKGGYGWDVSVTLLDLQFADYVGLFNMEKLLLRVKACKGALDAIRDELPALEKELELRYELDDQKVIAEQEQNQEEK